MPTLVPTSSALDTRITAEQPTTPKIPEAPTASRLGRMKNLFNSALKYVAGGAVAFIGTGGEIPRVSADGPLTQGIEWVAKLPTTSQESAVASDLPKLDLGGQKQFEEQKPPAPNFKKLIEEMQKRKLDPQGIPESQARRFFEELLTHEDPWIRQFSIGQLGDLKAKNSIAMLGKILEGGDKREKELSAKALVKISQVDSNALRPFLKTLKGGEKSVALDVLPQAFRAKGDVAKALNTELKRLFDEESASDEEKVIVAASLLQVGTAHQGEMLKFVLDATEGKQGAMKALSMHFLVNMMRRNTDPDVRKILVEMHAQARKDGNDESALCSGIILANIECIQESKRIFDYLRTLRGADAKALTVRIYRSYDFNENCLEEIKELVSGEKNAAKKHPDRDVRMQLLKGIRETFKGPEIQEWVIRQIIVELFLFERREEEIDPSTRTLI